MEYHVALEINGKRELIILEHVKEEYGVSEQEFWSVWVANAKYICGDGDTAEQAIQDMIKSFNEREEIRIAFNAAVEKSVASFKTPIIDNLSEVVAIQYQAHNKMLRKAMVFGG